MADDNKKKKAADAVDAVVGAEAQQEEQAVIAYTYLPDKNPGGGSHPGVPLRDLLAHEVEQYPKWVQDNLRGSPMYAVPTPPSDTTGDK